MRAIDLIKISSGILKRMSEVDLKVSDYEHIEMFEYYAGLVAKYGKKIYARHKVAERYGMSESTVFRIIKRLEKDFKV